MAAARHKTESAQCKSESCKAKARDKNESHDLPATESNQSSNQINSRIESVAESIAKSIAESIAESIAKSNQ